MAPISHLLSITNSKSCSLKLISLPLLAFPESRETSADPSLDLHMIRQMHQHLTVNPDRIRPWWKDRVCG